MVRKIRCNLLFAIGEVYFISEIYFAYIDRLNMKNILRELREKNNWTQRELSSKLGVSTRTIISLEKGHFNPSIKVAYKCSLIFGCPIEKIFCLEENYDNDRKEILR